jgi:thioredoxin 1
MYELKSESEFTTILTSHKYVLIDFYAIWCGPCKTLAKDIELFHSQEQNKHVFVVKINVDNFNSLCEQYNISSLPTLKLFIDGKEKTELVGYSKTHMTTIKKLTQ